jgi:hypothetical protein
MSTLSVGTIQSSTTSPPTITNSAATEIGRLCRAWVNFNGTGTVAIRASFNVSSITDNGTGTYTVNFTNALPDADYAVSAGCKNSTNVDHNYYAVVNRNTAQTTTTVRIVTIYFSNLTAFDNDFVYVSIFR